MMAKKNKRVYERFEIGLGKHLRGRRLLVVDSPQNAVRFAVEELIRVDFTPHDDLTPKLAASGSAWVAQTVEIGQPSGFLRGCMYGLIEETLLGYLPGVRRSVPPTLVVVAAHIDSGATELVIEPHTFVQLGPAMRQVVLNDDDDQLAAPRVDEAVRRVIEGYQQAGMLIDPGKAGKTWMVDFKSPVYLKNLKNLTTWP
jgi:hypothetical protein